MFEIQSSEMAQDKARGPTKDFAGNMIAAYQKTSSELKDLVANRVQAEIPTELDGARQRKLDKLKTLDGERFNKTYDLYQVNGHKSAIKLFESYAKDGDNDDLKKWAKATLPTLKSHLGMAKEL